MVRLEEGGGGGRRIVMLWCGTAPNIVDVIMIRWSALTNGILNSTVVTKFVSAAAHELVASRGLADAIVTSLADSHFQFIEKGQGGHELFLLL
jgi:hypothetical protein